MGDTAGHTRRRPRGRVGWLVLVVLAAAGFAVVASRPPRLAETLPTGDAARAAAVIDSLLAPAPGGDPLAGLPADFTEVTGVRAARERAPDGTTRGVHVGGGCSAPWGDDDTRWDFSVGCKAHDLGYDLLRYAVAKGQPLGPERRRLLDERLSADMAGRCADNPRGSVGLCRSVAGLFTAGLVVNSWHQSWGPPQPEPIAAWSVALVVVALLLAVRVPTFTRRRALAPRRAPPPLPERDLTTARYLGLLRMLSLGAVVLAESALAFAPLVSVPARALWPLTWLLQLVPLFFLAGGYSNVLAWRAATATGGGYGGFLANRVCWLIRPVLGLVTAWLVVPMSLDLLDAPQAAVAAFGRLVAQPLWLLGLYLLVVCATPALAWLYRRARSVTPAALFAVVAGVGVFGSGTLAAHAGGVALALLFAYLAFPYADGAFRRLPRIVPAVVLVAALSALVLVTAIGGQPRSLIAEPAATASFIPSALGVLLLGVAQVSLVVLPRDGGVRRLATSAVARGTRLVQARPVTAYLVYLCAMLMVAGLVGAARSAGLPTTAVDWMARPSTMAALALLGVPALLVYLLFEWRKAPVGLPSGRADDPWDAVAAVLGTFLGAAGILGFAVTGLTGSAGPAALLGLSLDPMASVIHLLLGWYLLHAVRIGTASTPWPWLLAAIACVPPMLTSATGAGVTAHAVVLAITLAGALAHWAAQPLRPARKPATG